MKIKENQIRIEEWLFLLCFGIWFFFCCMYFSEWRRILPIGDLREYTSYLAIVLIIPNILINRKQISVKNYVLMGAFLVVSYLSELYSGTDFIFITSVWIVLARNLDKKRIVKESLLIMLVCFVLVIISTRLGFISNVVVSEERGRWSLGYTFPSFGSHMVLFISLAFLMVCEVIDWIKLTLCLVANIVIFCLTDTKVDLIVAVAVFLIGMVIVYDRNKFLIGKCGKLFTVFPLMALLVSYLGQYFYNPHSKVWLAVDDLITGRLRLGHEMMMSTPHTWMGQEIEWVSGYSTVGYNFVDNFFLHCGLNQGILYLAIFVIGLCYAFRYAVKKEDKGLLIVLMGITLHGLIDPQLGNLYWQPFILYIGCMFTDEKLEASNV